MFHNLHNLERLKMNDAGKQELHRNDKFTEYYYDADDTTGSADEKKTFVGRKHEDQGFQVADKLNKQIKSTGRLK